MSTKTTFKRVALVAVAALGFGMLSVVPSSAAPITPTAVTVGTVPTAAVGVAHTTPISFTAPYAATTDTFTVVVRITSAPAGSVYAGILGNGKIAAGTTCGATAAASWNDGVCYSGSGNTTVPATIGIASSDPTNGVVSAITETITFAEIQALLTNTTRSTTGGWQTGQTKATADVSITPDVAGTYTVLVSTSLRAAAAGT